MIAFGGFLAGEYVKASGYLVATVTGIVLGNYKMFFRDNPKTVRRIMRAIEKEVHFNESLATLATIFIFSLLEASLDLGIIRFKSLTGNNPGVCHNFGYKANCCSLNSPLVEA